MADLSLVYHGHVYDASGYGRAARAYIHAFRSAGIELSAVNLSRGAPQIDDPVVRKLAEKPLRGDFHLFHGIPSIWSRESFRIKNGIGMTVWETDTMPTQWRNTLNHVLEVWLPCDYNVQVFTGGINRPVAKLPHPIHRPDGDSVPPQHTLLPECAADEFVFYSIFEWQERKGPDLILRAFLQSFSSSDDAVLILKCNPGAARAAAELLALLRRETASDARVSLRCEAWGDSGITALHARGDCYVSLHRGEGWCYPLFDAACRGTPVIATNYSGPAEYLDSEHHLLVRYEIAPVRQRYMFYHPRMRWAEPDVAHASEHMRWVYDNRITAQRLAKQGVACLEQRYSLESVGATARVRLLELLERTDRGRYREIRKHDHTRMSAPTVPVSPDWFDHDYFETGLKSNWERGYQWTQFEALFRRTAAFLASAFVEARTFFDAGCAKGFLVRALRERGREAWGCDVSEWAIAKADHYAKPYVFRTAVENLDLERDYNVLVAFHLLSQLTEEQVHAFLTRVRPHIKMGICAVIPLYETPEHKAATGGDLGHITRESRQWWHERFMRAGWRQDGLHKNLEATLQRHDLPQTMLWQVFLYSSAAEP